MRIRQRRPIMCALGGVVLLSFTSACGLLSDPKPHLGIDLPREDSEFWIAYEMYIHTELFDKNITTLPIVRDNNGGVDLSANVESLVKAGAKALILAPQDTRSVVPLIKQLQAEHVSVVTVDTAPDSGQVYMVVRTDNRTYGTRSCEYLGQQLHGHGRIAVLEGDLNSGNGRDRTESFQACMKQQFPKITVDYLSTGNWDPAQGSVELKNELDEHPELGGIYLEASIFWVPTIDVLQKKHLFKRAGQPGHVIVASNDGTSNEIHYIRDGYLDATIDQPADLYARYGIYYAQAALAGQTFRPGPTDHNSIIVQIPSGLEDVIPAPLVTRSNVDDPSLWGNTV